jgi:hypothetical protein
MKTKAFASIITSVLALIVLFTSGLSVLAAELPPGSSLNEAPQNLTVELKEREDGRPYFVLRWKNPESIWELAQYRAEQGEGGADYQIDMKIGAGN